MAENLRHRGNNAVGEQAQSSSNPTKLRIVLLGKTGVGKSSTGNTLLGENRFEFKQSLNSVTKYCSVEKSDVEGRPISVIDTPGFFDTTLPKKELEKQIARSVFESAPGVHAFLFVLPANGRFTEQEKGVCKEIQSIFGQDVLKYLILLFTNGEHIDQRTFKSEVKEHKILGPIVKSCQGFHVFNNRDVNNRDQVNDLLQKIDTMIEQNGGGHYTNQMLKEAQRFKREEADDIRREQKRIEADNTEEYFNQEFQRLLLQDSESEESSYSDRARMSAFERFWQRFKDLFSCIASQSVERRHNL